MLSTKFNGLLLLVQQVRTCTYYYTDLQQLAVNGMVCSWSFETYHADIGVIEVEHCMHMMRQPMYVSCTSTCSLWWMPCPQAIHSHVFNIGHRIANASVVAYYLARELFLALNWIWKVVGMAAAVRGHPLPPTPLPPPHTMAPPHILLALSWAVPRRLAVNQQLLVLIVILLWRIKFWRNFTLLESFSSEVMDESSNELFMSKNKVVCVGQQCMYQTE